MPQPTTPNVSILVVDDEPSLVDAVATALRYEGFKVAEATSGRGCLASVSASPPDLIVLDVMLPDFDGFETLRRLRRDGVDTPVLLLTARDDLDDKATGFAAGADDYLTKPFSLAELAMRVKAILKRTGRLDPNNSAVLTFADVQLDPDAHLVRRADATIELTATEFSVLQYFMENPGRVSLQSTDPRARLALRFRRRLEHLRNIRQLPPQEAQ